MYCHCSLRRLHCKMQNNPSIFDMGPPAFGASTLPYVFVCVACATYPMTPMVQPDTYCRRFYGLVPVLVRPYGQDFSDIDRIVHQWGVRVLSKDRTARGWSSLYQGQGHHRRVAFRGWQMCVCACVFDSRHVECTHTNTQHPPQHNNRVRYVREFMLQTRVTPIWMANLMEGETLPSLAHKTRTSLLPVQYTYNYI